VIIESIVPGTVSQGSLRMDHGGQLVTVKILLGIQ